MKIVPGETRVEFAWVVHRERARYGCSFFSMEIELVSVRSTLIFVVWIEVNLADSAA